MIEVYRPSQQPGRVAYLHPPCTLPPHPPGMHHEDLSRSLAGSLLEVLAAAPALSRREVQLVLHEHSPVVCIECRHRVAYVQVIFERDERAPRGFVRYAVFTLEKGADRPRRPMRVLHFSGAEFGALYGYVTSTLAA